MTQEPARTFSGHRRSRKTKWTVKMGDALARTFITIGGLGTIVAVTTVCVFLVWVVVPMFAAPDAGEPRVTQRADQPVDTPASEAIHVALDDYNLMAWTVQRDGVVRVFRLDTGEQLEEQSLNRETPMTAWSFPKETNLVAIGYADGTVRLGRISFQLDFLNDSAVTPEMEALKPLEILTHGNGLVQRTPENQFRTLTLRIDLNDPVPTGSDAAVVLLDKTGVDDPSRASSTMTFTALTADDRLRIVRVTARRNMMTRKVTMQTVVGDIPYEQRSEKPYDLRIAGLGDNIYLIWPDGVLRRFDCRTYDNIAMVEEVALTTDTSVRLTKADFLIGKTTLLVGDSAGNITTWFRTRPDNATTRDNYQLSKVHVLSGEGAGAVTSIASSQRNRMVAIGHDDGKVRMHNVTNERFLFEREVQGTGKVDTLVINARDNGLLAMSGNSFNLLGLNLPHPEVSLKAIFTPIWYEGYNEPRHVWQSTGGTDDFESKFGIMPLVFGTIKATFYSLLFAVPLALLAAIYTSEFLSPNAKARIKPTIETMASLPSVVLGFLAGLVIAQFLEDIVPAVLTALVTVPVAFLVGAYIWQAQPAHVRLRYGAYRFLIVLGLIPFGIYAAYLMGPLVERFLFKVTILKGTADGNPQVVYDIKTWLTAHRQDPADPTFASSPFGGWMLLFLPFSILIVSILSSQVVNPLLTRISMAWSWARLARLDALKFVISGLAVLVVASILSALFGLVWDPRGSYVDQYVQRNALIVGFMMGFAVIPIIYTIAEDALSSVPEHLRAASLGAGATQWQTAIRIIIPTAMSGLFSAVMIGFGRAVGETMIVLMAAGNTPIMEWNIFNGFRTLSANIAVEMMEAVKNSTNYRILFFSALVLFIMTFCINTIAELVRLRYRKRAIEL